MIELPIWVIMVEFVYSLKTRRRLQNVRFEFRQDLRHYCFPQEHLRLVNFIDWRGSKSEIYFEDFETSRTFFYFCILHFLYVRRMW